MKKTLCITMSGLFALWLSLPANASQLGSSATTTGDTVGVQSYMTEPSVSITDDYPRVYQVSTTLPDGTFIQDGWVDWRGFCSSGFSWFVTILLPNGGHVGDVYNTGGCGITGARNFGIVAFTAPVPYEYETDWTPRMSGDPIGPSFRSIYGWFQRQYGGIFTEVVKTGTAPPDSTSLGRVEYDPTRVKWKTDQNWHDIGGARAVRSQMHRPPYYLHVIADDDVSIGRSPSASSCPGDGDTLW